MGKTKIEWTRGDDGSAGETWNPTTGCDRVSAGCDHCYALTMAGRLKAMGNPKYQTDGDPRTSGPGFGLATHVDMLDAPFGWRKPRRVFVNSMSDLFHPDVPDAFIGSVWNTMALTPQHTYQILTKRPQRMAKLLNAWADAGWMWRRADQMWCGPLAGPLPNVWLGTSVENQRYANLRIPHLLRTPAAIRFISAEPLLGPLDLLRGGLIDGFDPDWCGDPDHCDPRRYPNGLDLVIAGGESGPNARPMHPDWARGLRDQCACAGVAFFFKQWGAWQDGSAPNRNHSALSGDVVLSDGRVLPWYGDFAAKVEAAGLTEREFHALNPTVMARVGKKNAGRVLDGRTYDGMP